MAGWIWIGTMVEKEWVFKPFAPVVVLIQSRGFYNWSGKKNSLGCKPPCIFLTHTKLAHSCTACSESSIQIDPQTWAVSAGNNRWSSFLLSHTIGPYCLSECQWWEHNILSVQSQIPRVVDPFTATFSVNYTHSTLKEVFLLGRRLIKTK